MPHTPLPFERVYSAKQAPNTQHVQPMHPVWETSARDLPQGTSPARDAFVAIRLALHSTVRTTQARSLLLPVRSLSVPPVTVWVSSGCSGFLPQSKGVLVGSLIGHYKLSCD